MKAITISQPFASLISKGEKWTENRTWETKYRGSLAIHAGKGTQYLTESVMEERGLPIGQFVAVAELVACIDIDMAKHVKEITGECTSEIQRLLDHKYCEGPITWVLKNVRAVEPFDAVGKQGLWVPSPEQVDRLESLCLTS